MARTYKVKAMIEKRIKAMLGNKSDPVSDRKGTNNPTKENWKEVQEFGPRK